MMLIASCAQKDAFTITGTLPSGEYDGQQVFLMKLDSTWNEKEMISIDTANVVDSKFVFKGLAKQGAVGHYVVLQDAPAYMNKPVFVIVEPGKIEITMDSVTTIKGTPANDSYQAYTSEMQEYMKFNKSAQERYLKDTANVQLQDELQKEGKEKYEKLQKATFDFVKANINNQVGAYYLTSFFSRFKFEEQKELVAEMNPEFKSVPRVQKMMEYYNVLEATSAGKAFTDLKGKTPEGKDAALSDYAGKGKVVLVDFWASWCGPCIAEMPKVKEVYNQYKDKGFEIVAISLDRDGDAWKKSIKDLGITWPQISDLKFWQSDLSAAYGVRSIPHTVLIDKDGKIVTRGLRADDMAAELDKLLK